MEKKQAVNPYLPPGAYIPDGEPHVFGDRVYIYGSHDQEGGEAFCLLDYEVFSAPVDDLGNWKSEGIAYRKEQDPSYSEKYKAMYAPDVVKGNDGRYYLYYAMAGGCFTGPIHVAVSDSPAGSFAYHGCVRNADGSDFTKCITFDPGVINDDGTIRLYYGWSLAVDEETMGGKGQEVPDDAPEGLKNISGSFEEKMLRVQMMMFDKTEEEVRNTPWGIMGANVVELEDDMLTVRGEPARIVPGQFDAAGTGFEGHAFFEASSIRKIKDMYYFIYSSEQQHELCYATSKYPDRDFVYGGTIISNGDIGLGGREKADRLAATGNNHGSIEYINGEWYVFYHRQTHKTSYSRQGCAEKIQILADGSIPQVEMTSCGLNGGPLLVQGAYSATIACNLTNGAMPHTPPQKIEECIPYITSKIINNTANNIANNTMNNITSDTMSRNGERFIADIGNGTRIGYKYFHFDKDVMLELLVRGEGQGSFKVFADEECAGTVLVAASDEWRTTGTMLHVSGDKALYLQYEGSGLTQLKEIRFKEVR